MRGILPAVYLFLLVVFMGSLLANPVDAVNSLPICVCICFFWFRGLGRYIPASGKPVITGTAQLDWILTVDTSGITDANSLVDAAFTYQWVRVDGSDETDIQDATDSTYTPVSDDVGKKMKVEVSFTDDDDYAEGPLASDPTGIVSGVVLVSNINQSLDTSPVHG